MLFNNKIKTLKNIINNSEKIVFFGGAGVSTESGIPDFRSETNLFKTSSGIELHPTQILKRSFFLNHTEDFYKFHKSRMIHLNAKPNDAHLSLYNLSKLGKLSAIITQNIDGLHRIDNNENLFELHGSVLNNYCVSCCKHYNLEYILKSNQLIPKCIDCGNIIKPDVVLYEENLNPFTVHGAVNKIKSADTLIIGGTSLVVQPAASLIKNFTGKYLVIINKSKTQFDQNADLIINDSIGKVLSKSIPK